MRTITLVIVIAAALSVAAPLAAAPTLRHATASVTVRSSSYGRILFDGRGFVLYAFTADTRARSNCSGACAKAWPPFIVKRAAAAGTGATRSLLGTTRRGDRSLQVTY